MLEGVPTDSTEQLKSCELAVLSTVSVEACSAFEASPLDAAPLIVPGSLLAESNRAKPAGAMLSGWAVLGLTCPRPDCRSSSHAGAC